MSDKGSDQKSTTTALPASRGLRKIRSDTPPFGSLELNRATAPSCGALEPVRNWPDGTKSPSKVLDVPDSLLPLLPATEKNMTPVLERSLTALLISLSWNGDSS